MNRLNLPDLARVKADLPAYDLEKVNIGIVHFGPGAFHRAHQAAYVDKILSSDPRWGICGVSLHSKEVRDALMPQSGLYTLAILDEEIAYRVIGSVREILVGPEDIEAVLERLSRPEVAVVTSTVTEKGYCLDSEWELDLNHPDIVHDLAHPNAPKSFIGYVVAGLKRRKDQGRAPFVLIPCDNLPANGVRLKRAILAFATHIDLELTNWISINLQCPCTMVDSITPATDDALRLRVAAAVQATDAWPIQREAFTQWVIESHAHLDGPDWAAAGVILTDNVPAFERAKLRLLNGPHSALAYLGLHKGYETVAEAMGDQDLANLVEDMMLKDIVPLLEAPAGMDLTAYCKAILKRFRNPAIRHLLSQIAWDGSQKLPIRILSSLNEALERGADVARLCIPIAAWMRFVRLKAVKGEVITDPLSDELIALALTLNDSESDVVSWLSYQKIFDPKLMANPEVMSGIKRAYLELCIDKIAMGPSL